VALLGCNGFFTATIASAGLSGNSFSPSGDAHPVVLVAGHGPSQRIL